jgi:SecD/SecF fusion protein
MRRFIAFIILGITLLTLAAINIPGIGDNMNQGIEFKGGFEILYQVLDQNGTEYNDNEVASAVAAASEVISNRIDIAGVKNPLITIEGRDSIRVTVASRSEQETREIRNLLTSNAEITFRDVNDRLLATADQLLEENGARLDYNEGQPVVALDIKDTALFEQITAFISGQASAEQRRIVIWLGFQESYPQGANELGFTGDKYSEISRNPDAAGKIVSDATVNQTFFDDVIITGSFSAETAKKMADLILAGTIDFSLREISVSSIGASYGDEAFNRSLIAGIIGLSLVGALMIYLYGIAGIASAITLFIYVLVTLIAFNLLKGEYGPDTIAATVIGIGMAVDANIIMFERIKDELFKGKSLRTAFYEGTRKSLSSIIDANITTLIAGFALYFFGTRTVKGFATMLIISLFFTMVIVVLLAQIMVSLVAQSQYFQDKPQLFGAKKKFIPDLSKGETRKNFNVFEKFDYFKYIRKMLIVPLSIFGIGIIAFGGFGLATGSPLNLGLQFSEGTKLYTRTINPNFDTVEEVYNFFENDPIINSRPDLVIVGSETISLTPIEIELNRNLLAGAELDGLDLKVYTVSVNYKRQLDNDTIDYINELFYADSDKYAEIFPSNYTLNFVSPIVAQQTVRNAFYALLIASLLIIVYVAWRFKFSYAVSAIIALIHDALIAFFFFTIFRIEINIEFVSATLAIIGYSVNDTIVTFDRLRENVNEFDGPKLTHDDRVKLANKSLQETVLRSVITTISTLLTVLALLIFGSRASINFNIAMLIGLTAGTYSSVFIAPYFWVLLEDLLEKFRAKYSLNKVKVEKKSNEPEEYTFYGIND